MKRHPLDLASLIPGLLFVAAGITFLAGDVGSLDLDDLQLVWPAILIVMGAILLTSVGRGRDDTDATGDHTDDTDDQTDDHSHEVVPEVDSITENDVT